MTIVGPAAGVNPMPAASSSARKDLLARGPVHMRGVYYANDVWAL